MLDTAPPEALNDDLLRVLMGTAQRLREDGDDAGAERLRKLATKLNDGLLSSIPDVRSNGHPENKLPGMVHVCLEGIEGEAMLLCLDMNRVCVSSGSACTTGSLEPSHVLLAMGMRPEVAHGSVRFTLGRDNTEAEVDYVLEVFPTIVARLRAMSPVGGAKM